ncbi:hypothetical protein SAMN05518865_10852 [Duganella sp. CF458]|nr:hypothetical protein SAMN05518865_10852 [Duganella sp. CF458]
MGDQRFEAVIAEQYTGQVGHTYFVVNDENFIDRTFGGSCRPDALFWSESRAVSPEADGCT